MILITGAGVISAIGIGKEQTLQALRSEQGGVAPVHYLHTEHKECMVGEVKESNGELAERLGIAKDEAMVRTSLLGISALREALAQAGLDHADLSDTALVNGTTVGGMDQSEKHYLEYLDAAEANQLGKDGKVPVVDYIRTHDCGSSTDLIADHCGRFGMTTTISTACSSAANAIILGARMIEAGEYDRVVVGGAESLSKFHLNGFNTLMILDQSPCRPMDATRAGLNLGEGAAYLVLERAETALARGVRPLARLAGYGNACDAYHQTASSSDGEGAFRAMQQAMQMAGCKPGEIDYINCHGTGTPNNDPSELEAMRRVFGETLPPFSSTKGYTGHTTSASGSIEAVFCLLAMQHSMVPANLNFAEPIQPWAVPIAHTRQAQLRYVLCNAFGFGGNDSAVLFAADV
ncbi:MAG: beta-ketoacyl-[acyl-carrier-protein] synthase family protein [Bacteroidales bacterium]|nr:beta-ketoacyl-[acyl-carrier-protein] synthase family protein [Bacteroidales bacterium]